MADTPNENGRGNGIALEAPPPPERTTGSARDRSQATDLLSRFRRASNTGTVRSAVGAGAQPTSVAEAADQVLTRARALLPEAQIEHETDLFDAGLSSVDAVELVSALAREVEMSVSLDDVFADARPLRIARAWGRTKGLAPDHPGDGAVALRPGPAADRELSEELQLILADLALADRLPFAARHVPHAPTRILLTGATGFFGSHLLVDLLREGTAEVVCLVRAEDDEAATARVADTLRSFDLPWNREVRRRVTVLAGDLRTPRLGLSDERWTQLADEVDSVVNVAAAVDFLRGYNSLRQTNVLGPLHLAELALTGKPKPLHHVSSVAVFNELGVETMGEDDQLARIDGLFAGYDRSKWAAECALRRAREHGLAVTILRPGAIAGHTQSGAYNPRDLSTGLIGAMSRYRTMPAFAYMNMAPVDWVSRTTAAIVYDPEAWGRNYHVTGRPETLQELVKDTMFGGMNIRVADWRDWRDDLLARYEADPVPELDFLVRMLRNATTLKLLEALLYGPAARADRTELFLARRQLPAPQRYGAEAQLKAFERMADDGVARLPAPDDSPYLSFSEHMDGWVVPVNEHTTESGPAVDMTAECAMEFTLSIASMYQVVRHRRVDVSGQVTCRLAHAQPLIVTAGRLDIRPDDGIPREHGSDHPLMRYRLDLVDDDGRTWWLEGWKTARPQRNLWAQTRTLDIEIGRDGEPASIRGTVSVPSDSYVPDQIDGIRMADHLTPREQRVAKLSWLSWFFLQVGAGLAEPAFRVVADVLDLRRDAIDRDEQKLDRKIRKLTIRKELSR